MLCASVAPAASGILSRNAVTKSNAPRSVASASTVMPLSVPFIVLPSFCTLIPSSVQRSVLLTSNIASFSWSKGLLKKLATSASLVSSSDVATMSRPLSDAKVSANCSKEKLVLSAKFLSVSKYCSASILSPPKSCSNRTLNVSKFAVVVTASRPNATTVSKMPPPRKNPKPADIELAKLPPPPLVCTCLPAAAKLFTSFCTAANSLL